MSPQGQPYYGQGYGQPQQMAPPAVYAQPYSGQQYVGQPMYAAAPGQPGVHMVVSGQPVNAIPVQVAIMAPPRSTGVWGDGICDCCNTPQQFCMSFVPFLPPFICYSLYMLLISTPMVMMMLSKVGVRSSSHGCNGLITCTVHGIISTFESLLAYL
jgi:hypothetical protein